MKDAKRLLKNQLTADELVEKLLVLARTEQVCLLDSCGVSHLKSRFLIGGINPSETFEMTGEQPAETLSFLDQQLDTPGNLSIFTLSYDFGMKLEKIKPSKKSSGRDEPDVFLAVFPCLIIHNYQTGETCLIGDEEKFNATEDLLFSLGAAFEPADFSASAKTVVESNFTKAGYLEKVAEIKEFIRRGDTYQTNLTQQFSAELPEDLTPPQIFHHLRKNHPAPFAAFLQRRDSVVISASPERFVKVRHPSISTSPIKGTRPRGKNAAEDEALRNELVGSEKDRAENIMIVDLLRNDLGRICEFGSVRVEKLCDLETHPTLFHLVSTVAGRLRGKTRFSDIVRAVFPCGSITGAPKIRTMHLIERLEPDARGLSMGAIGYSIPGSLLRSPASGVEVRSQEIFQPEPETPDSELDLSVAIRTMIIKDRRVVFNVGGGIVIDSVPEEEYEETLTKAKALLNSINGIFSSTGNNIFSPVSKKT